LTPDDYAALLELQGGGCAICGGTPKTSRLAVDHDHTIDGKDNIRGLLCSKCNQDLLGGVRHSARLAARAAWYLTYPPAATGRQVPDEVVLVQPDGDRDPSVLSEQGGGR
jgi:hypothetical protein